MMIMSAKQPPTTTTPLPLNTKYNNIIKNRHTGEVCWVLCKMEREKQRHIAIYVCDLGVLVIRSTVSCGCCINISTKPVLCYPNTHYHNVRLFPVLICKCYSIYLAAPALVVYWPTVISTRVCSTCVYVFSTVCFSSICTKTHPIPATPTSKTHILSKLNSFPSRRA